MIPLNEVNKAESVLIISIRHTNDLREIADKLDKAYTTRKNELQNIMIELVPGVNVIMDCNKTGFAAPLVFPPERDLNENSFK
jgi:hypothetical protein